MKRLLTAARLMALGLAMFPSISPAAHSWSVYHWARTANPFTLKLVKKLTSTWSPYLDLASAAWTTSSKLNTTIILGSSLAADRQACATVLGQTVVCNYAYGLLGWTGLATVWVDASGHITKGTAKMNDSYSWTPGSRQLVMCQEVGHTLGLGHQDELFSNANLGTCMDYTSLPFGPPNNLALNSHDHAQLNTIYTHVDGYTTPTLKSPNSGQESIDDFNQPGQESIDFNQPDQWGTLINSSDDGRTSVYELDLGDGNKVVTYVIWAKKEVMSK